MFTDFILNDSVQGPVAEQLGLPAGVRFDPGFLRPFINENGVKCVSILTGRQVRDNKTGHYLPERKTIAVRNLQERGIDCPVFNTTTALRKEQWIEMDRRVVTVARTRLRFWRDLLSRVPFGGFDAFARMTLEYEAASDPGEAQVSMDGLQEGRNDMPRYSLRSIPLPIVHSDFQMSSRLLANSRNGGTPLDMTRLEASTRRVAETVEAMALGTQTGPEWGTVTTGPTAHTGLSKIYGAISYPYRLTKTDLTVPTGDNPDATVSDFLEMRQQMFDQNFFGPFQVYHSSDWDTYLDNDYVKGTVAQGLASPGTTLRERLRRIDNIEGVTRLDNLTPTNSHAFTLLMVQMVSEVVEAINGMEPRVVQWTEKGGMDLRFKVMAIQVARWKHTFTDQCGVLHARTA